MDVECGKRKSLDRQNDVNIRKTLSVVVPVYNSESYLEKCLDSISQQTYGNLEIILVDDGSTDSSGSICDSYAKRDVRIRVIHQANLGPMKARLHGVEMSHGDYVTCVDSDDWLDTGAYQNLIEIISQLDVDVICFGVNAVTEVTRPVKIYIREGYYSKEQIIKDLVPVMLWDSSAEAWHIEPSLCNKIFRRNLLLQHMRNAQSLCVHYGEDMAVFYPLMLEANTFYMSTQYYYNYRQRSPGQTPSYVKDKKFFEKTFSLYQYLKEIFIGYPHDELLEQLDKFYIYAIRCRERCYKNEYPYAVACFPFTNMHKGANAVLYGCGTIGKEFMRQNKEFQFVNIICCVDNNYLNLQDNGFDIESPEIIVMLEYDYIVIAVESHFVATEIYNYLRSKNVDAHKIIWARFWMKSFVDPK